MIKKRNWAFVMYPESMPINWHDILQETGCPIAISPLHDNDINADNTPKKPHYHVIICYDGPTTSNVVSRITNSLNATIPIPLEQVRGYYRYLTHQDNPEKYQYDYKEIILMNGFDVNSYTQLSTFEVYNYLKEIQLFIRDNHITEYSDLLDILLDSDLIELWNVASSHTILLDKYITSRRFKTQKENIDK